MPFASHLSKLASTHAALDECLQAARGLGQPPDLALVFYSPHHRQAASQIGRGLWEKLQPRALLGCQGETIIGNDEEVEENPALAVWVGAWPAGLQTTAFHLSMERTADGFSLLGYPDELSEAPPKDSLLLTLADPFTFPIDHYLEQVNKERPGL